MISLYAYKLFSRLGLLSKDLKEWQLELYMETLEPTPINHKLIAINMQIVLTETMIALVIAKIESMSSQSSKIEVAA